MGIHGISTGIIWDLYGMNMYSMGIDDIILGYTIGIYGIYGILMWDSHEVYTKFGYIPWSKYSDITVTEPWNSAWESSQYIAALFRCLDYYNLPRFFWNFVSEWFLASGYDERFANWKSAVSIAMSS